MSKHAEHESGLNDLLGIILESMMLSEHYEFPNDYPDNKDNGFCQGRGYGQDRVLESRIPRDRLATYILRYWLCCVIKKSIANDWLAVFTVAA